MTGITYNQRGFAQYGEFIDSYGAAVRVCESSSAEGPHIWLSVKGGRTERSHGDNCGFAHLTIKQAKRAIELLQTAITHAEQEWEEAS